MQDMVFCHGCGKEHHRTASKCPHCGISRLRGKRYKNKAAAGVLGLLIGGLGVHRFYLGQWWGIFYLLFFWTAIPGIVSFVEGIVMLCTDQQKWDEKYNEGIAGGEGSGGTIVIVAVVVVFVGIAIIGILAAIAIPAYQDYTMRARVLGAIGYAQSASLDVSEYVQAHRAMPTTLRAAGFNTSPPLGVGDITLDQQSATIVVTMNTAPIAGKTVGLRLDEHNGTVWQCVSLDMPQRYLPRSCRE